MWLTVIPACAGRLAWGPTLVVAAEEYPPHVLISDTGPGQDYVLTGPMEKLLRILSTQLNFTHGITGSVLWFCFSVTRCPVGHGITGATLWLCLFVTRCPVGHGITGAILRPCLFVTRCPAGHGITGAAPQPCLSVTRCPVGHGITGAVLWPCLFVTRYVSARGMRWWERLVLGAWMVLTLVLMRSYAGTLMSLLAVRQIPQPFQDLRRLLDDPDVTMVWEAGSMYVQFLMPEAASACLLPEHLVTAAPPITLQAVTSGIFREVREAESLGRLVFVKTTDYNHVLDQMCDFYASRAKFLPFMFAMVGRRYSPLVPALSARIGSVTEAGLYDSWLDAAIPNDTSCVAAPTKVTVTSSLGLVNLWGMFTMLGSGAAVAGLALVGEVLAGHL
ncbi:hypothetical protein E2C01_039272 [Portunus trituberculatus]|uniref:Ionotropic glutamate receptor C-terminal domain-containing protein n=1 Tax=Portunus trituberculatus TaxID=210409 RepID=A0A5B7FKC1_PORTR|nr:hypothetical protein [Portunus trituberculatus]